MTADVPALVVAAAMLLGPLVATAEGVLVGVEAVRPLLRAMARENLWHTGAAGSGQHARAAEHVRMAS